MMMHLDPTRILPGLPWALPCTHSEQIAWHWDCPQCGGHTLALHAEETTADCIAQDARCWYCRTPPIITPH